MKAGRFRKGKKAFKKGSPSKLFNRYLVHIERIRARRIAGLNASMVALVASMGIYRIAMIQATPQDSKINKALRIAHEVINMAQAIPKAFQTFSW